MKLYKRYEQNGAYLLEEATLDDIMEALSEMWQPIESAPKDGSLILVKSEFSLKPPVKPRHFYQIKAWNRHEEYFESLQPASVHNDIGWLPLPKGKE